MNRKNPWWFEERVPCPDWAKLWEQTLEKFDRLPCLTAGGEALTYRSLNSRAKQIASILIGKPGWREFPLVALGVDGVEFLSWAVGTWLAGGTIVPYCPRTVAQDPAFGAKVKRFAGFLVEGPGVYCIRRNTVNPANLAELASRSPEGWHGVYFTSGSTGEPRAVVRGWKQAYFEAGSYSALLDLNEGDRCVSFIRPFFGASTKHLLGCLLTGCHQWLVTPGESLPQGRVLYATPSQMQSFPVRSGGHVGFEWVSLTGEAPTVASWPAINGWSKRGGRILNSLGGTEFGVAAVEVSTRGEPLGFFAGRPIPGKELRVLTEKGSKAPQGENGLLNVSSRYLAEGYLDPTPDGAFQLAAFEAASGVATGDVAHLDHTGLLRIAGRAGRMVKRGGKWLDTGPLLEFLSRHEGISQFSLEKIGNSQESTAWLVPRDAGKLDLAEVRREMMEKFCDKLLVPVRLVSVTAIPINRHGKADPSALSDPRNRRLILEIHNEADRLEPIAYRVAECLKIGKVAFREPFVPSGDSLDSLEWHELATLVEKVSGRRLSVADLLALNSGDERVVEPGSAGMDGLRVFPAGARGSQLVDGAREGILWFGGGIGTVTTTAGPQTPVWHWDCDRCMKSPVTWKESTIQSMAFHFLMQAGRLPDSVRVGGFSLGALVAYEVTRLLVTRGTRVEACILVDPPETRGILGGALTHLAAAAGLMGLDRLMRGLDRLPGPNLAARIRRAARRLALVRYRGGTPSAPTHLFTSDRNSRAAIRLVHGDWGLVQLASLGVKRHVESVRDGNAVRLWSRYLLNTEKAGNDERSRAA